MARCAVAATVPVEPFSVSFLLSFARVQQLEMTLPFDFDDDADDGR
jgi:hypothetical protein